MSEIKLLPCPFCGGEAKLMSFIEGTGDAICINYEDELEMDCSFVYCYNCDMDFMPHTEIAREVLKAWNTRKPMQEIVEKIKEKLLQSINKANDESIENGHTLDFEHYFGEKEAYEDTLLLVKEVGGIDV